MPHFSFIIIFLSPKKRWRSVSAETWRTYIPTSPQIKNHHRACSNHPSKRKTPLAFDFDIFRILEHNASINHSSLHNTYPSQFEYRNSLCNPLPVISYSYALTVWSSESASKLCTVIQKRRDSTHRFDGQHSSALSLISPSWGKLRKAVALSKIMAKYAWQEEYGKKYGDSKFSRVVILLTTSSANFMVPSFGYRLWTFNTGGSSTFIQRNRLWEWTVWHIRAPL